MVAIAAGHAGRLVTGTHTKVTGTVGDLHLTMAKGIMQAGLESFPTADGMLPGLTV